MLLYCRNPPSKKSKNDESEMIYTGEMFVAELYSKTESLKELQNLLDDWVEEYEKFCFEKGWNELIFHGKLEKSSTGVIQFNFSGKLLAILHHLEKKGAAHPSIKRLKEIVQQEPRHYESPYDDEIGKGKKHEHLIPESLEVEKDIFCKVRPVSIVLL